MVRNTQPPTDNSRVVWTAEQQERLEEQMRLREAAMRANRPPVLELAKLFRTDEGYIDPDALTDWLIEHATLLRSVLAPFDLKR